MTVPEWMTPPEPTPPARGDVRAPWIVDQRPGPDGTVRVTWATSDLRRIVLTIPETVWQRGEHSPAGALTAALLARLDPAGEQHNNADRDDN